MRRVYSGGKRALLGMRDVHNGGQRALLGMRQCVQRWVYHAGYVRQGWVPLHTARVGMVY